MNRYSDSGIAPPAKAKVKTGYAAGVANPNDPSVAAALAKSAAANPQASKGGYEGATPMVDPVADYDPYGVGGDPILAKIKAGNAQARQDAESNAATARKQLAIMFGDASGISDDSDTALAARNNPFSTLANLLKGYNDNVTQHGEGLNKANLWYSGAHAKSLAEDATNYQHGQYDARNAAMGQLGDINGGLAGALSNANAGDNAAAGDAYGRAQQRATTYGIDPGASQNNAATNLGKPAVATKNGMPIYGNAPKAGATFGAGALAKTLGAPKIRNPYLTNPNKRG